MFQPSEFSGSAPNMPESHLARLLREIANMEKSRSRHRRGSKTYRMYTKNIERLKKEVAAIRAKERAKKAPNMPAASKLSKHIHAVKARIVKIKRAIRVCKRNIFLATGATVLTGGAASPAVAVLLVHLNKMERALHHNRHLLKVLLHLSHARKPSAKVIAAVVQVAAATAAAPVEAPPAAAAASTSSYPAPETPAPEQKDAAQVVEEAKAEEADPAAAEKHDDEAAGAKAPGEPKDEHDLEVSATADAGGKLVHKPMFWLGVAVVTAGTAYYKRDKLKMLLAAGRA